MAWITLSLRKQSLRAAINDYDMQLLNISRDIRQVQRHKSTDVSIFNMNKQRDLQAAREEYIQTRDGAPDINSPEYQEWQQSYTAAREDYLYQKEQIEDMYDADIELIEQEASDKETALEQEQTLIETQLAAIRAEYESVSEQVKEEIKNSAISFE